MCIFSASRLVLAELPCLENVVNEYNLRKVNAIARSACIV